MAFIANEALVTSDLVPLIGALDDQEAWSDFPIVVLTTYRGESALLRSANGSGSGLLMEASKMLPSDMIVAAAREAASRFPEAGH